MRYRLITAKERIRDFLDAHPRLLFFAQAGRITLNLYRNARAKVRSFTRNIGVFDRWLERDIFRTFTVKKSLRDQINVTIRYRATSSGIGLTENERKLLSLHNIHKGQRAFLIGNGPSLNKCDMTFLKDEITIGANAIYLNYPKMGFHPTYYVVEDIAVAEDRKDEINALTGPRHKFFGNYLDYCFKSAPDVLWLNVRVNYADSNEPDFPGFSKFAAKRVWVGGTVSYIGMQLAYYFGISELYLLGFDHNYIVPDSVIKSGKRFTSTEDDPNHFDPNYFGKGYRWHDPNVARMERAYQKAKEFFEKDGRMIYNATVGGKLEVFDRVDYNRLFSKQS